MSYRVPVKPAERNSPTRAPRAPRWDMRGVLGFHRRLLRSRWAALGLSLVCALAAATSGLGWAGGSGARGGSAWRGTVLAALWTALAVYALIAAGLGWARRRHSER